ncbi:hypothetical protein B0H19DRAFT_1240514 [Mycena capillaripes]|nr:hypothetical protein B0H19DRAFT_1240514 [Mycena capillaripes]
MSSASNSTTTLVSSTAVSLRAPLNGSTAVQPKDFQSAFATLQSTYGFISTAPSPVPKKSSPRSSTTSVTSSAVDPPRAPKATTKLKSAFADLQSTCGFSGAVPSLLSQKREGGSFFSKFRYQHPRRPATHPTDDSFIGLLFVMSRSSPQRDYFPLLLQFSNPPRPKWKPKIQVSTSL